MRYRTGDIIGHERKDVCSMILSIMEVEYKTKANFSAVCIRKLSDAFK